LSAIKTDRPFHCIVFTRLRHNDWAAPRNCWQGWWEFVLFFKGKPIWSGGAFSSLSQTIKEVHRLLGLLVIDEQGKASFKNSSSPIFIECCRRKAEKTCHSCPYREIGDGFADSF
jgi:hypothetical protein